MRKRKVTEKEINDRIKKGQYIFLPDGTCMTYAVNKLFEKYAGYPKTKKPAARKRGY